MAKPNIDINIKLRTKVKHIFQIASEPNYYTTKRFSQRVR